MQLKRGHGGLFEHLIKYLMCCKCGLCCQEHICILYFYLYFAQYLHVQQNSKCYMTHPTVQVQSNSQITDIPLTESQRLKDDHLSMSLRFFNLQLRIGPNDRALPF